MTGLLLMSGLFTSPLLRAGSASDAPTSPNSNQAISAAALESREQLQPFDLGKPASTGAWVELRSFIDEAFNLTDALRETYAFEAEETDLGTTRAWVYSAEPGNTALPGKAILHIHGGAYVVGSPATEAGISIPLSVATGMKVFSPAYGLAPESPYPAALNDMLSAYNALVEVYGPGNIAVTGSSAGGGLALSLVLTLHAKELPLPFAIGLLSPWSDLTKTGDSYYTLEGIAPILDYELTLEHAARLYAGDHDLRDPLLSPVYARYQDNFPQTLIMGGTRDLFLSNCVRLHRVMRSGGADATLSLWDGMWHAFYMNPSLPESSEVIAELAEFVVAAGQEEPAH